MRFIQGETLNHVPNESFTWNTNPIYQSPERSGISWYDQANHWNPEAEGLTSIPQHQTETPIPYWAERDTNLASLRTEFDRSSRLAQNNASAALATIPETPASMGSLPTPMAPVQEAATRGLDSSKGITKAANVATGVGSGALGLAAMAGGPLGSIAMANAALGSGTAAILNASNQSAITNDYAANVNQNGSNSGVQARIIRDLQTGQAAREGAGAQMGGLFGPVGALLGNFFAGLAGGHTQDNLYDKLKTGYSFDGRFNPQDTGSVNSSTTADLSGTSNMTSSI